ncbi:hypothetical protein [Streptomyces sp. NPDC055055]
MADEPVNTPIQTKYAEQLAADLATNLAEQAEVAARLDQLKAEEKWLTATLESMPVIAPEKEDGPVSAAPPVPADTDEEAAAAAAAAAAVVPQPREPRGARPAKKAPAKKVSARKSAAKKAVKATPPKATSTKAAPTEATPPKAAATTPAAGAKKSAVQQPARAKTTATATARKASAGLAKKGAAGGVKAAKAAAPTLGELLGGLLARQPGEPKKVSEIYAELEAAHPERATSHQVVRNALEKLVAKDGLEKDTRQGVVLYTWPGAGAPAAAEATAAEQPEAVTAGV